MSHPLTNKIWLNYMPVRPHDKDKDDKIITDYLREKSKEIRNSYGISWGSNKVGTRFLDEILGLSLDGKIAHTTGCQFPEGHECSCKPEKPKETPTWCEHMYHCWEKNQSTRRQEVYALMSAYHSCNGTDIGIRTTENWEFCPICGTPRPQAKSLAVKFKDEFARRCLQYTELGE